jgi:hypothetical protein
MFRGTQNLFQLAQRVAFVILVTLAMSTILLPHPVQSAALQPTPTPDVPAGQAYADLLTGITDTTREIFRRGQINGNRVNVFSKVGDSATVDSHALYPIGWGAYILYEYDYLLPVIRYFSFARARDANSFANHSLSAGNGWTTADVFNPPITNIDYLENCRVAEAPLLCEYRVVNPSIALIMLGTNDVVELTSQTSEAYLRLILDLSIERGIVPVLSTIPIRIGYEQQVADFNHLVKKLSAEYSIPLWDFGQAMRFLPHAGLSEDGVHPSSPPGPSRYAADFSAENLQYGYVLKNISALHVLDRLWREVIFG